MKTYLISLCLFLMLLPPPLLAGDPFAGSNVYVQHCANCHGGDGRGAIAGTSSFRGGRLLTFTNTELVNAVVYGKNLMPAYRGILDDQQIDDVITYIRTFN